MSGYQSLVFNPASGLGDLSSLAGFGALGGMGGQDQSAFGAMAPQSYSPMFDTGGSGFTPFELPTGAGAGGTTGGLGFGFNVPTAQLALGGLSALSNLWGGIQANKMAKKQFKFAKTMSRVNLANQVKSYNTALADRARGRAVMESQTDAQRDAYVHDNMLSTKG